MYRNAIYIQPIKTIQLPTACGLCLRIDDVSRFIFSTSLSAAARDTTSAGMPPKAVIR
jgi:hypothetical protein